uniref:Uncharacterized protein n=1 Tax=Dulem virus 42 TaxID=3145760 RepID=A0AAU8B7Q5_9CAUD
MCKCQFIYFVAYRLEYLLCSILRSLFLPLSTDSMVRRYWTIYLSTHPF